jgi:hypothetical protein
MRTSQKKQKIYKRFISESSSTRTFFKAAAKKQNPPTKRSTLNLIQVPWTPEHSVFAWKLGNKTLKKGETKKTQRGCGLWWGEACRRSL